MILNDNGQVSLPTGQPSAGGVLPAGALSGYTGRLLTSSTFKTVRDIAKSKFSSAFPQYTLPDDHILPSYPPVFARCFYIWPFVFAQSKHFDDFDLFLGLNSFMPDDIKNLNKRFDEYVRGMATGGTLFEELGEYRLALFPLDKSFLSLPLSL